MSYKNDIADRYVQDGVNLVPDLSACTMRLELTNICNHKCVFCAHHLKKRKPRFMEKNLALRLLKEAYDLGVRRVALFMNGEPFLVNELPMYVKFCKELGYDYVFITTNASIATEEQISKVMMAGIDSIKFSINAGTRESYLKIHGSDDYDKAMAMLKFASDFRKNNKLNCKLLSGFVVTNLTKPEMELQYNRVKSLVDDFLFFKPDNFGGYMVDEYENYFTGKLETNLPYYDYPDKKLPCSLLFNSVNITCEGFLTLCCSEALNYMVTCDLNVMSLKDAWQSPIMIDIRKKHIENNVENTQCYKCMYNVACSVEPLNKELFARSYE